LPPLPCPGAQIRIWRIGAARPRPQIDALRATLTEAETARADAFRTARDRDRFIVFRGALRDVLGRGLGLAPDRVALAFGPFGKPHLPPGPGPAALHFNLAHSGDLGLLAVCDGGPVGIDVELARPIPRADRIAARVFAVPERAAYDALPAAERPMAFLRCWTRKEAYLKATGDGLSFAPERICVTLGPAEAPRIVHVDARPGEASRWRLHHLDLAPLGAVGALAAAHDAAAPRWLDYAPEDAERSMRGPRPCPS